MLFARSLCGLTREQTYQDAYRDATDLTELGYNPGEAARPAVEKKSTETSPGLGAS